MAPKYGKCIKIQYNKEWYIINFHILYKSEKIFPKNPAFISNLQV